MRVGQSELMSYVLLTFFIFIILVVSIIMAGSWFSLQSRDIYSKSSTQEALNIMKMLSISPIINVDEFTDGYMFSDSKLTALNCSDIYRILNKRVFIEIKIPGQNELCTDSTYPDCGIWKICNDVKYNTAYEIPVNIYRHLSKKIETGVMVVGVHG